MPVSRGRHGRKRWKPNRPEHRPQHLEPTNTLDLHFPILALKRGSSKAETAKGVVYGTAFPIAPGILITAAHVFKDAHTDGIPILSKVPRVPGQAFSPYPVDQADIFSKYDLAILRCTELKTAPQIPLEFDRGLEIGEPVSAIGFPMAVDPEWVSVVHRGFFGTVITRREMYHIPGQPPGYELSFYAPQGLSGAPLVSDIEGDHRCYGYVVQQSTIGAGAEHTPIGIAIDIRVLLEVNSRIIGGPIALAFGRKPVEPEPPTPPQLRGGLRVVDTSIEDWPDDPPIKE